AAMMELADLLDAQSAALAKKTVLHQPVDALIARLQVTASDAVAGRIEPAPSAQPAAKTADAPKPSQEPGAHVAEQTIRVEVSRLEALLNLVGQLVLNKNRVLAISRGLRDAGVSGDQSEEFVAAAGDYDRLM